MITDKETYAIFPIIGLALVYICRDILLFNRLLYKGWCVQLTSTQFKIALVFYPIWIYIVWVENLSQKRENYTVVISLNITNTLVGWWTTVAIFNDNFIVSRQQMGSLIFTFILNALWRVMNILMFSD